MIINVNNVNINYEEYGNGVPIILLHGNGEKHQIFNKLIEKLQNNYKVYAIDSRCHGNSEKAKEISYELMANDMIDFIKKLKIEKPIIYGFSDGGIIGLIIAIKEPQLLSKLILSGANISPDGISRRDLLLMKIVYFFTRNKLVKMMIEEPNIKLEELKEIQIPTHILVGEKDAINIEHTKLIADNISNSTLEIIQNENHGSYIINSNKIYDIIKKYL